MTTHIHTRIQTHKIVIIGVIENMALFGPIARLFEIRELRKKNNNDHYLYIVSKRELVVFCFVTFDDGNYG